MRTDILRFIIQSSCSNNAPEWDYRNYRVDWDNALLKGIIDRIREGMKIMKMMNINIVDKIREVLEMTNSESTAYYNRESDEIVWVFE